MSPAASICGMIKFPKAPKILIHVMSTEIRYYLMTGTSHPEYTVVSEHSLINYNSVSNIPSIRPKSIAFNRKVKTPNQFQSYN